MSILYHIYSIDSIIYNTHISVTNYWYLASTTNYNSSFLSSSTLPSLLLISYDNSSLLNDGPPIPKSSISTYCGFYLGYNLIKAGYSTTTGYSIESSSLTDSWDTYDAYNDAV